MSRKTLLPLIIVFAWLSVTACLLSGDFPTEVQSPITLTETPENGLLKSTQTATSDVSEPMPTPTEASINAASVTPPDILLATETAVLTNTVVPTHTSVPVKDTPTLIPPAPTATQLPPTSIPPTSDPNPSVSGATTHEFTIDILALVNQARCANGITALSVNNQLSEAALRHNMDMVQHNFVSHTGTDGSDVADRITDTGYGWVMVAENIAAGMQTPQEAFDLWMDSPSHRDNIMHLDLREMGLAVVNLDGTEYGWYWTQVFGSQGQSAVSCTDVGF